MPQEPTGLNSTQPIVESDGTISQIFRTWAGQVTNSLPIVGSGTPEGVRAAPQYSLYIDEAVPLTPLQYRKMLPEIGGDRTKGWALI